MTLELVIRPFQTAAVTPPTLLPVGPEKTVTPKQFKIGDGSIRSESWSFSSSTSLHGGHYKEIKRTTEKKKVYNPDDKTQYVTVERAKSVVLRSTKDPSDKRKYDFKYPADSNSGPPDDGGG